MLAPDAPCVINIDDPYGKRLSEELAQAGITNQTFSAQEPAFCRLTGFEALNDGSRLQFQLDGKDYTIHSKLRGEHNAVNLLQTVTVAYALGIPMETILLAAESAPPAPGRLECITLENGATAYVDFAHTHDALERVLLALKKIRRNNGRIITVFGCGGDRDRTKRPKTGFAAGTHSDICIVTSDNPRSEDPDFIISEILPGIPAGVQYHAEPDRRKAILLALDMAKKDDIILIAGKGHEKTQEIKGVKYPFSDAEVIRNR
jgi:UDP-N-acetylmuramoyl-L-alanyl-D-glutamate--2,6-diaminopimelate ligase